MRNTECRFRHLSFAHPQGRQILSDLHGVCPLDGITALCGPNGCGKSSLLALLAGELAPTGGGFDLRPPGTRRASQRPGPGDGSPGELQRDRLGELFRDDDTLLLLDEPTNHLDSTALRELEQRLRRRRSPTLLVSHDRDLLDRIADRTWWLEDGALVATEGGFTVAWEARQARLSDTIARRETQDARLRAVSRRIQESREEAQGANRDRTAGRRMKDPNDRDATSMAADFNFRSAQSRKGQDAHRLRRELGRLESQETISVQRDTLREIEFRWDREKASRRLSLPAGGLEAPDGSTVAHRGIALDGRSRVRLVGPNGSGKTTVLSRLAALDHPGVGHLPQEPSLDDDLAFLESLRRADPRHLGRILSLAAALGASGAALIETASPSPGEARKLRIAALLADPSWMLLLDEPTNHLDAASIQRLQEALERWPGGLVLATHDERLAQAVCAETWRLEGRRLVQGR